MSIAPCLTQSRRAIILSQSENDYATCVTSMSLCYHKRANKADYIWVCILASVPRLTQRGTYQQIGGLTADVYENHRRQHPCYRAVLTQGVCTSITPYCGAESLIEAWSSLVLKVVYSSIPGDSLSRIERTSLTSSIMAESSRYLSLCQDQTDSDITCYVCLQMHQRKPQWKQDGAAKTCLLCNNDYCDKHKSTTVPGTCELSHETYCSKAAHKQRHAPVQIFRNMKERENWIAANGDADVVEGNVVDED